MGDKVPKPVADGENGWSLNAPKMTVLVLFGPEWG